MALTIENVGQDVIVDFGVKSKVNGEKMIVIEIAHLCNAWTKSDKNALWSIPGVVEHLELVQSQKPCV